MISIFNIPVYMCAFVQMCMPAYGCACLRAVNGWVGVSVDMDVCACMPVCAHTCISESLHNKLKIFITKVFKIFNLHSKPM